MHRTFMIAILCSQPLLAAGDTPATTPSAQDVQVGIYGGADNANVAKAIESGVDFLMPSVHWYEDTSWLKSLVERVRPHGISIYPSLALAYDGYGDRQTEFARTHPQYWEKRRDGRLIDRGDQVSLSWGYPEVRAHKVSEVRRLVEATGVDGVLLDYTRFFGNSAGYSEIIVKDFRSRYGTDPLTRATDDPLWTRFRADYVTQFVAELRKTLDVARPGVKILACVNPAETLRESMQDWKTWVQRGLVDGVVTMIYERNTNDTLHRVMIANRAIEDRVPHFPMIAPYGGNLTTPELLKEGARKCLSAGVAGVAFYREDAIVEHKLWPAIAEIAEWHRQEVSASSVNYVLNSGFENGLEFWATGSGEGVEVVEKPSMSGNKCLHLSGSGQRLLRQVIDHGFHPGRKGLILSLSVRQSENQKLNQAFVETVVNLRGGREHVFRMPIELAAGPSWRQVEAHLPVLDSSELNFIALGISVEGEASELWVDDLSASLIAEAPQDTSRYLFEPSAKARSAGAGVNIARGQPVRGSSFWENGFEFSNAVDGDLSSDNYGKDAAWHSQRPAANQWIVIHLPTRFAVTRIRLLNASAHAAYRTREYRIETSLDDAQYEQVVLGTLPDDGTTWTEINLPPTPAQYIRFTGVTGYHLDYAVGLKEIEVFAE